MGTKEDFPKWKWNEYQQVGTDYTSEAEVAIYDRRMRRMRLAARRQMPAQQPAADKTIVSCGPPRESPSLPCSYYTPGIQKKSTDFVTNL